MQTADRNVIRVGRVCSLTALLFAAYLHSASSHEIAELRLGKKTEQLYADAEKLQRQLDRYAYGPPQVRFNDSDVDQARAAGALIEFQTGRPIIVDRPLYRELVKGAIKRTHDELEGKDAEAAKGQKTARSAKQPADPVTVAKRERDAQLRELTVQAHGANLGVDPASWTLECLGRKARAGRMSRCREPDRHTRRSSAARRWR